MHEAQGLVDVDAQAGGQPVANVDEVGQLLHEVGPALGGGQGRCPPEPPEGLLQFADFLDDELHAQFRAAPVVPSLGERLFHSSHEPGQHGQAVIVFRHGQLLCSSRER